MKRILCALLFVFGLLTSAWADSSRYASESVLNSGKWVKIQVAEDGIYKLTATDLKKMGFSNLDKVAVYVMEAGLWMKISLLLILMMFQK